MSTSTTGGGGKLTVDATVGPVGAAPLLRRAVALHVHDVETVHVQCLALRNKNGGVGGRLVGVFCYWCFAAVVLSSCGIWFRFAAHSATRGSHQAKMSSRRMSISNSTPRRAGQLALFVLKLKKADHDPRAKRPRTRGEGWPLPPSICPKTRNAITSLRLQQYARLRVSLLSRLSVRLGVLDEVKDDPGGLLRPAALASGRHEGVLVLVPRHLIRRQFIPSHLIGRCPPIVSSFAFKRSFASEPSTHEHSDGKRRGTVVS